MSNVEMQDVEAEGGGALGDGNGNGVTDPIVVKHWRQWPTNDLESGHQRTGLEGRSKGESCGGRDWTAPDITRP